jgi:hypothetical protein
VPTVSTPAQWAELVTTALLGTDRRPLDAVDPPVAVLREAARHRVLDRLAEPEHTEQPPQDPAPPDPTPPDPAPPQAPEAPAAADRLLTDLLQAPDPALITCWLRVCADHGRTAAAIHWTPLARLASRTTAYDRSALGAALGHLGRWFLHQNPEWRKLAADAERPEPRSDTAPTPPRRLLAEEVLADPERLLAHPQPWGPELVSAAYAVLGGEGPVAPTRSFATRLGVALPTTLYPTIAQAGEYYVLAPDASPARRRTIRDRFVALELAAYARAAIDHAFDSDSTNGFTRAEIPHV